MLLTELPDLVGDAHSQVLEELRAGVVGGVEGDLAQVAGVDVGEEHRLFTLDVRVRVGGRGDPLLEVGDEILALLLLADGLGLDLDVLAPRGAPGGLALREGDGRGDLGELVVLFLVESGVAGEDDVGLRVGDGLVVDAVGLVEQDRRLVTGGAQVVELVLHPGQDVGAAEVGLGHADRDHAEGERDFLVLEVDGGDALGVGRDLGGAEGMLDGDVAAVGAVVGGAGRQRQTEDGGDEQRKRAEQPLQRAGDRPGGGAGSGHGGRGPFTTELPANVRRPAAASGFRNALPS